MKYSLLALIVFLFSFTALAAEPANDFADIQGTWLPVKAEINGQPLTNDFVKSFVLKLNNGKYESTIDGGKQADAGDYTINPAIKPKTLDITGTGESNTVRKIPGIYELRGNTLRVCLSLDARARPTDFKSMPGSQYFLVTYQRKKVKN